jgi:uncharacterized protein YbaP (TraB family)
MSTAERIQQILDCDVYQPERDEAGIITPHGIDYKVRRRAREECLKIAEQEEAKQQCRT